MSYEPASFAGFGAGLNLRDKVDVVNEEEAIDCLNVAFTERGSVTQRDGYDAFTASGLTNRPASLHEFYTSTGTRQLIAGCGSRLEALNTSGAVVAASTGLTDGTWDFARVGAPGSEYIYAGQGNDTLRRWDGTTWTAPASMPAGGALATMAVDQGNRLVVGRFNTTTGGPTGGASTSNPSRVHFSDPGAPETWGTNNYIDFTPGDGEKVQAIIAWREFVFVFKETKFFVVYGSDEDVSGEPIFRWRTIDTGVGLASPRAVAAGPNAVYFMARDGVYSTTGGDPTQISDTIDPIWAGGASDFYTGGVIAHSAITNCAMTYHAERLYLAFPTQSVNDRLLVYDPRYEWWSLWDIPASAMASFRISDQAELVFGYASGTNHVGRHNSTLTNDDGTAITSFWRSGWFDYELPVVKVIRETKLWGSGKVFLGLSADFDLGTGDLDLVDFTDPVTTYFWESGNWEIGSWSGTSVVSFNPRLRRRAVQGTTFSTMLRNTALDQSWSLRRLTHHLLNVRPPSVRKVEA